MGCKKIGNVILCCGGPMFKISVNQKVYEFEMHHYCGPNILKRNGEPRKYQPLIFLHAASLWAQQGQRVKDGLCIWDHPSVPITKRIIGNHYKIVGYTKQKRGS